MFDNKPRQRMITIYCEVCQDYKQADTYNKVCEMCLGRKCKCARIRGTAKAQCSLCKNLHVGGCMTWVCDDHLEKVKNGGIDGQKSTEGD